MSPLGDLARQDDYLPDVGPPLIPSGPQFSPGVPAVNQAMGALLAPRPRDPQSPVAYRTASPLVNITEQDITDATEAAMAASGGGLGIKAYHSSPHDFERFDLSKIGTGEGAQVYGHGLYFAENPAVSGQGGQYWKNFQGMFNPNELSASQYLEQAGFDRGKAIENLQRNMVATRNRARGSPGDFHRSVLEAQQTQLDLLRSDKPVGPRTYEVDIKADPAHFLDWDKELHRQSPEVQSALARQLGIKANPAAMRAHDDALYNALTGDPNIKIPQYPPDPTGAEIYRNKIGPASVATRQLDEAGIPGIKYLDQQSRITPQLEYELARQKRNLALSGPDWGANSPEQIAKIHADIARIEAMMQAPKTSNYVVFDPRKIDILRKYGIAGAAPLGMGALAAQDQYNQP